MGRYRIHRHDEGRFTILYRHGPGATPLECGIRPVETPIELLRGWTVNIAAPGDVFELEDGLFVRLKDGAA
jgi:hypothetical protein